MSATEYVKSRNARLADLRKRLREAEEQGDRRKADRLRQQFEATYNGW